MDEIETVKEVSEQTKETFEQVKAPEYATKIVEDELKEGWINVTETSERITKLFKILDCKCGNTQKTYAERAWCRCLSCGRVLIDESDNMSHKEYLETDGEGKEEETGGLMSVVEKEKEGKYD